MRPHRERVLSLREIANFSCSCSLHSPSDAVHSFGIRGLTSRHPSVVDTAVMSPAGNGLAGLGSTHGARVIDSTPPTSTTSASPDSIVRDPIIAASRLEPQSRLTVVAGSVTGKAGQQHRHAADVAVVLAGAVGVAPDDITDVLGVEVRHRRQHATQGRGGEVVRRGRRTALR